MFTLPDLVELRPGLGPAHAKDPTVQKARADFKQAGRAALNADPAFRWFP